MPTRGLRILKREGSVYHWRVYHRHGGGTQTPCAEVLAAFLEGFPRAPLRVFFPENQLHGSGFPRQSGVVCDYRTPKWSILLHRPKIAAILVEIGEQAGWSPRKDARHAYVIENGYDFLRDRPEALERMLAADEVNVS